MATRRSLFGPVLLIVLGALLLALNLRPELSAGQLFADHWPWLLLGWGAFRLIEQAVSGVVGYRQPRPLGGGAIVVALLLCLAGAGARQARWAGWFDIPWPDVFSGRRGGFLPVPGFSAAVGQSRVLVVSDLRGRVDVIGVEGVEEVRVSGRRWFRDRDSAPAQEAQRAGLVLRPEGERMRLTASGGSGRDARFRLTIEAPRSWDVRVEGGLDQLNVKGLAGGVEYQGSGDVRAVDVEGVVKVRFRNGSGGEVRVERVGGLDLDGSSAEVRASDVIGDLAIRGNLFEAIELRRITGAVDVVSRRTRLSAASIEGSASIRGDRIDLTELTDPRVESKGNQRLRLVRPRGRARVFLERGRLTLEIGRDATEIEARVMHGDVEAHIDPAMAFSLEAQAKRGEIRNRLIPNQKNDSSREPRRWDSEAGAGPTIRLESEGGDVEILPLGQAADL